MNNQNDDDEDEDKKNEEEAMNLVKSPKDLENERYYALNKAMIKNRRLANQLPDQSQMNMFSQDQAQPLAPQNTSFVDPVIVHALKTRIASEPDPARKSLLSKKLNDYVGSIPTLAPTPEY